MADTTHAPYKIADGYLCEHTIEGHYSSFGKVFDGLQSANHSTAAERLVRQANANGALARALEGLTLAIESDVPTHVRHDADGGLAEAMSVAYAALKAAGLWREGRGAF